MAAVTATARALREIRPEGVDPTAPVVGLTDEALTNRVRAAAHAASLGDGFTGHSSGIGMARRMVAAGAVETWQHGDPLHSGRGGRRSAEVADLSGTLLKTLQRRPA